MGISGNELADQTAKNASSGIPEFICCPYTDWFPYIKRESILVGENSGVVETAISHILGIVPEVGGSCKLLVVRW